MPTTETWTVKASGGDYTTLAAALAAKVTNRNLVTDDVVVVIELYINTVESVTIGTGATMDATHYVVISGGAYNGGVYADDGFKHRGRPWGAKASIIGGACISPVTGSVIKIYDLTLTSEGGGSASIRTGGTVATTMTIVRCQFTSSRHWGLLDDSSGSSTYTFDSCLFWRAPTATESTPTAWVWLNTGSGATVNLNNCIMYGGDYGVRRVAGTINAQDCYALATNTADWSGTIATATTCASEDGTKGTTVSEAAFARRISRLSTMLGAGTFDDAPAAAPGKTALLALYRATGSRYGVLSGDAAIASGLLTGTTGGYNLPAATVTNLDNFYFAVKATNPGGGVAHGLGGGKRASGNINRWALYITTAGALEAFIWDNTGTLVASGTITATPVSTEYEGAHTFAVRLTGGVLSLEVDRNVVASQAYAGTRDATDTHLMYIGTTAATHLGAGASVSSWARCTGGQAALTLPLPYYADGAGMLDDFRLTRASSATLKTGGTAAGAPTLDATGRTIAAPVSIGACEWEDADANQPGFASLTGAGGLSGNAVQRFRG